MNLDNTFCDIRSASHMYANAELIWYLSGARDIDGIAAYAPQYERFSNRCVVDDDYEYARSGETKMIAHGAYGHRWARVSGAGYTQLAHVIRTLKKNPNTRQAVLACWNFEDDAFHAENGTRNDIPCTMTLKFYLRDGKLHCVTDMRSNDLWLGLPYDVYCFTAIQRLIADAVGAAYGTYTHTVGSLHIYDRNREKLERKFVETCVSTPTVFTPSVRSSTDIKRAVRIEDDMRNGKNWTNNLAPGTMLCHAINQIKENWE